MMWFGFIAYMTITVLVLKTIKGRKPNEELEASASEYYCALCGQPLQEASGVLPDAYSERCPGHQSDLDLD
jgi:hypothetical protein